MTIIKRNNERIRTERQSAVDREGTAPDGLHNFGDKDGVEDNPPSDSAGGIAEIATECDLLSPATRIHPAYTPLQPEAIRLLKITPDRTDNNIHCDLEQFHIHTAPKYIALSYTWGSRYGDHKIYVNGCPLLIPKNLWRFLGHARALGGDLLDWLWVDMLSINQRDITEKSIQVSMIHGIFSRAESIVVWLGPSYRGSDAAMEALARSSTYWMSTKRRRQLWASPAGSAIKELCARAYWTRLWIFQELRVAQDKRIMCASKSVPWSQYESLMLLSYEYCLPRLDREAELLARSPAMYMIELVTGDLRDDVSLWYLIENTAELCCADIRDKAYALLGIAECGNTGIESDYSEPVPTLLNKVLQRLHMRVQPKSIEEAQKQCSYVAHIFNVHPYDIYVLNGQRGAFEAPPEAVQLKFSFGKKWKFGPERWNNEADFGKQITLWWVMFYGHAALQKLVWAELDHSSLESYFGPNHTAHVDVTQAVALLELCQHGMDQRLEFTTSATEQRYWSVFDQKSFKMDDTNMELFVLERQEPSLATVREYIIDSIYYGREASVAHLLIEFCVRCAIIIYPFYKNPAKASFRSIYGPPFHVTELGVDGLQLLLKYGLLLVERAADGVPVILRRAMNRSDQLSDFDFAVSKASRARSEGVADSILSVPASESGPPQLSGLAALLIALMIKFGELRSGDELSWAPLTFATGHGQVETIQVGVFSTCDDWHLLGRTDGAKPAPFRRSVRSMTEASLGFAARQTAFLHTDKAIIRLSNVATSVVHPEPHVQMTQEGCLLGRYRAGRYDDDEPTLESIPLRLRNNFRIDILPVGLADVPGWDVALSRRWSILDDSPGE